MNQFVCFLLFKLVLPIFLIASAVFRFNALSFIYLLLFLVLPLMPSPTSKSMRGHTGRFIIAILLISLLTTISHLSFQIYLLANAPYGGFLKNCEGLEVIFRYVGFVRYDDLDVLNVARNIVPEVLVLVGIMVVVVATRKKDTTSDLEMRMADEGSDRPSGTEPPEQYKMRRDDTSVTAAIGIFLDLLLLAAAGIARPSIVNAFYFICFLMFATWIACYKTLRKKFKIFRIVLLSYSALHLIALYIYQLKIMQELIPPDNFFARLFGLTNLVQTDCTDPRIIHFYNQEWAAFANPGVLLVLYWVLAVQSRNYLTKKFANKKRSSERSPLLDAQQVMPSYQAVAAGEEDRLEIDPNGSAIWSSNPSEMPLDADAPEDGFKSLKQWLSPIISIFQLITRQSYIATLIVMMAWSITYISWLTFVLLLWSCILWMMPDSRNACWKSSPFLVIYAEALVIIQYVYGLNLNNDELPPTIDTVNLAQIGLEKTIYLPCIPLAVKILYTFMFWMTLRQYTQEQYRNKNKDIAEGVMMQPVSMAYVTVSPGADRTRPDLQRQHSTVYSSALMKKIGIFIHSLLTKYWIWVVALMLMLNALGGRHVVIFRIIYMILFLFFILMFQLSYRIWRAIMYGFWLTVIIYSMTLLILIYTYQFENFPHYWAKYLHISKALQKDIGLEVYDTGGLFINLLRATFFVIITIIQLHYFHNEFLRISDINQTDETILETPTLIESQPLEKSDDTTKPQSDVVATTPQQQTEEDHAQEDSEVPVKAKLLVRESILQLIQTIVDKVVYVYNVVSDFCWRYLEIHVIKIVLFSVLLLALYDPSAVNFLFVILVVVATPIRKVQTFISHCCAVWAAVLLISKMIYQINYVSEYWTSDCNETDTFSPNTTISTPTSDGYSPVNKTINNANWVGFQKTDNLTQYIKGYLGLIFVLTIQAVVKIRMRHHRKTTRDFEPKWGVVFPEITRSEADNTLVDCAKFLINFGFYKFGIEICLMTISAAVGIRLDVFAVIYALWLAALFLLRRRTLMKVWPLYVTFLCCILPIQYLMCLGLPPGLCYKYIYDTDSVSPELRDWLFLPDYTKTPHAYKLTVDFILLLFASCQLWVFNIEKKPDAENYEGGSNQEIIYIPNYLASNKMTDYVTYTKSYLDLVKVVVFSSFYWITLAIFFLAGTNRVSLFAMGYVIGCFLFLWNGQEFFMKPIKYILKWWNVLISYTVVVIFIKSVLQLIGCVWLKYLYTNYCWLIQLLSIACLNKFEKSAQHAVHAGAFEQDCQVPVDDAGLLWEGICLAFLLMQKRFFCSYYFPHLVTEMRAQAALANRGAELINQMLMKEVAEQQAAEKEIVEKIKKKMDKIRMNQQKIRGSEYIDPDNHFTAIRSGDYYLFEDFSDDEGLAELEYGSKKQKEQEAEDDEVPVKGIPVTKLLASAMKTDIKQAVTAAKQAKGADSDVAGSSEPTTSGPTDRSGKTPVSRTVSGASGVSFAPSPRDSLTPYDPKRPPRLSPGETRKLPIAQPEDSEVLGTSTGPDSKDDDDSKTKPKESIFQRIQNLIRFLWVFLEGLMISATSKLNFISRNYRYVARCLSKEKKALKEKWQIEGYEGYSKSTSKIPEEPLAIRVEKPSDDQTEDSVIVHDTPESLEKEFEAEQPPIVRLVVASWYAAVSRSEIVCYIMIVINQINSASILSLPLPLMTFLWGTLSIPRPSKTFWITIITYTEAIVVIKYMFQFGFFPWNNETVPPNKPFWAPRIMGIEKKDQYALYDLALLLVVFFHRFILKSLGLWKDTSRLELESQDLQKTDETKETAASKEASAGSKEESDTVAEKEGEIASAHSVSQKDETTIDQTNAGSVVIGFLQYIQPVRSFIDNLLSPPYRVRKDVYAFMFLCDFITFLIVVFGYWAFGTGGGDGVASYFEEDKVPVPFLVMLIAQFGLIVADRALFLRKYILGKLIFQIFIVFLVHIWMFFILPAVSERQFNSNLPPQLWYFVKCMYLLLSAFQIRSGYPTRILGNFLTKKYNYLNLILFKGFMLVPFLFELRALMDWIWTDTSMAIGSWLKMEDIFANIFMQKCLRRAEAEYPVPRGEKRNPIVKYGLGGSFLFVIILIIWFPLVLFALQNTVGLPNRPTGCTIEVSFSGFEPIFKMSAQLEDLKVFTPSQYESLSFQYRSDSTAQSFLSNYDSDDVYVAQLSGSSTSYWIISPPSQEKLVNDLYSNYEMTVKFSWQFYHAAVGKNAEPMVGDEFITKLPPNETARLELAAMIKQMGSSGAAPVMINNLMPKYIRVPSSGKAIVAKSLLPRTTMYNNLSLVLKKDSYISGDKDDQKVFWVVQEDCENNPYKRIPYTLEDCHETRANFTIVSFNDKVFPATLALLSGFGLMGLYTTLVLLASRYVRAIFAGVSYTIMFDDMPNVDRILQLCLDIYLVRESQELKLEEDLFAKLIFLYRSPETLIKWTRYPHMQNRQGRRQR